MANAPAIGGKGTSSSTHVTTLADVTDPLTSLFKKNKLAPVLEGVLSMLRASGGSYTDRYNFVKYSPTHNATRLEAGGLRIEGASTNLIAHSSNMSDVAWSTGGAISVLTGEVDAANGNTAARLTFNGINDNLRYSVVIPTGTEVYTESLDIKGVDGETVSIQILDNTATVLKIKQITLRSEYTKEQVSVANNGAITNLRWEIRKRVGDTASVVTVSSPQLEPLPFASSHIPTTIAQATRSRDIIQFTPYNNMPNVTGEFTIVFSATRPKGSGYSRPFGMDKYTFFYARIYPNGNISISGVDGNSITTSGAIVDIDRPVLYAITQSKTDLTAYVIQDGVVASATKVRSAVVTKYPNPTKFVIGNSGHAAPSSEAFFGTINDFEIYDKALSKSKLLSLAGR